MAHPSDSSTHERAIQALPPMPAVALRVIQVAQNPRSSASDLAMVIGSDPALSARILRVVNSAAYRRTRQITSVQEGLVMLGFIQARNIAISSAVTSAYARGKRESRFNIDAFWRHSIAVAFRSSDEAAGNRKIDSASAFTAGIVHDMGRLAMLHADPAGMEAAVARALASGIPLEQAEQEVLDYDHAATGGLLAERWNLPQDIVDAIAHHHSSGSESGPLGAIVAEADRFCFAAGILPAYEAPVAEGAPAEPEPDVARLMRRVDELMEMVGGSRTKAA